MPHPPQAVPVPSREHAFLLACGASVLGGEPNADPGLLEGLDAARLGPLAAQHGMLPLAGRWVGGFGAAGLPLRGALRAALLADSRSALALTADLLGVIGGLEARGVPVVAYKGPALAAQAYGDPSLRRFGDLDLVVAPGALERAVEALQALGFTPEAFAGPAQRRAALRDGHHLALTRGLTVVELHWRFGKRVFGFGEALDGVWERRQLLVVAGARVPVLAPADHMLALSIHASKGMWSSLEWTLSIAALARALPEDGWDEAAARARAWGCARALQVSLLLSEALFATPAPAALWTRLPPDRGTRALARRLAGATLAGTRSPAAYLRAQLALRRGAASKLGFLLRSLFVPSPGDWEAAGGARGPALARLARPLRLFRKYRGGEQAPGGSRRGRDG